MNRPLFTLFGNLESGNVHKVQLLLARLGAAFVRVDVAQTRGEPRRAPFLALNPIGKVPVLMTSDGDVLSESGAILFWLAQGSDLWPTDRRGQAETLRWMFFEQYSHEPTLAVLRYLLRFSPEAPRLADRIDELTPRARAAIAAMDARLAEAPWFAGDRPTIADYALYPYSKWSDEAGVDIAGSRVEQWLRRVEALPGFLPLRCDGAERVLSFDEYFGREV